MRISDWSSDVCSSDLLELEVRQLRLAQHDVGAGIQPGVDAQGVAGELLGQLERLELRLGQRGELVAGQHARLVVRRVGLAEQERPVALRSEEHTSELQSLMRISYAVFCLKKKTTINTHITSNT